MSFLFKRRIKKRDYPDLDEYIKKHYTEDDSAPVMGTAGMAMASALPSAKPSEMASAMSCAAKAPMSPPPFFLGAGLRKESANACRESAPMEALRDDLLEDSSIEGSAAEESVMEECSEMMVCASMAPSEDEECLDFEEVHESRLEERIKHLSDTFSQYLMFLIEDKKMKNADVYKRAIVDKKVFSKIKNDINYHPQKQTALCLCVGAKLNLDESKDLLARAGYALSPCDKTDIIFSYFIENEIYDMIELDIQLEEHGLPCIIS